MTNMKSASQTPAWLLERATRQSPQPEEHLTAAFVHFGGALQAKPHSGAATPKPSSWLPPGPLPANGST